METTEKEMSVSVTLNSPTPSSSGTTLVGVTVDSSELLSSPLCPQVNVPIGHKEATMTTLVGVTVDSSKLPSSPLCPQVNVPIWHKEATMLVSRRWRYWYKGRRRYAWAHAINADCILIHWWGEEVGVEGHFKLTQDQNGKVYDSRKEKRRQLEIPSPELKYWIPGLALWVNKEEIVLWVIDYEVRGCQEEAFYFCNQTRKEWMEKYGGDIRKHLPKHQLEKWEKLSSSAYPGWGELCSENSSSSLGKGEQRQEDWEKSEKLKSELRSELRSMIQETKGEDHLIQDVCKLHQKYTEKFSTIKTTLWFESDSEEEGTFKLFRDPPDESPTNKQDGFICHSKEDKETQTNLGGTDLDVLDILEEEHLGEDLGRSNRKGEGNYAKGEGKW